MELGVRVVPLLVEPPRTAPVHGIEVLLLAFGELSDSGAYHLEDVHGRRHDKVDKEFVRFGRELEGTEVAAGQHPRRRHVEFPEGIHAVYGRNYVHPADAEHDLVADGKVVGVTAYARDAVVVHSGRENPVRVLGESQVALRRHVENDRLVSRGKVLLLGKDPQDFVEHVEGVLGLVVVGGVAEAPDR